MKIKKIFERIRDKNVIIIAIVMPIIPRRLPCLDVSGDERPLNAKMNNIPEIK